MLNGISKEHEKTTSLEEKMKQDKESLVVKDEKIKESYIIINKLNAEIEELKKNILPNKKEEVKPNEDIVTLKQSLMSIHNQIENDKLNNQKAITEQKEVLDKLKEDYNKLLQSNNIYSHKILEATRFLSSFKKNTIKEDPHSLESEHKERWLRYSKLRIKYL